MHIIAIYEIYPMLHDCFQVLSSVFSKHQSGKGPIEMSTLVLLLLFDMPLKIVKACNVCSSFETCFFAIFLNLVQGQITGKFSKISYFEQRICLWFWWIGDYLCSVEYTLDTALHIIKELFMHIIFAVQIDCNFLIEILRNKY